jgi:MoaA/NifB/PqqE/SkfB family radical SAM enzyme
MVEADFDLAPFTIAWKSRACAFACVHCRADAQHQRDPRGSPPLRPIG